MNIVYKASNKGPMARDFEMKSQIRRAALSTMNNIAEGFGRFSEKEFVRFLEISCASAIEVKSVAYAAIDLGYWTTEKSKEIQEKAEDVKSLDLGFIRYLKAKRSEP